MVVPAGIAGSVLVLADGLGETLLLGDALLLGEALSLGEELSLGDALLLELDGDESSERPPAAAITAPPPRARPAATPTAVSQRGMFIDCLLWIGHPVWVPLQRRVRDGG